MGEAAITGQGLSVMREIEDYKEKALGVCKRLGIDPKALAPEVPGEPSCQIWMYIAAALAEAINHETDSYDFD